MLEVPGYAHTLANIAQIITVNFGTALLFVGMSLAQVVQERSPH